MWPIKNESENELFSGPGDAQESANVTTINAFEVRLNDTIQDSPDNIPGSAAKGALQDLYRDAQKDSSKVALNGTLQVGFVHAIVSA